MTEKKQAGWWQALWRPSTRYSVGGLAIFFTLTGVVLWVGLTCAMEITNKEEFFISSKKM